MNSGLSCYVFRILLLCRLQRRLFFAWQSVSQLISTESGELIHLLYTYYIPRKEGGMLGVFCRSTQIQFTFLRSAVYRGFKAFLLIGAGSNIPTFLYLCLCGCLDHYLRYNIWFENTFLQRFYPDGFNILILSVVCWWFEFPDWQEGIANVSLECMCYHIADGAWYT